MGGWGAKIHDVAMIFYGAGKWGIGDMDGGGVALDALSCGKKTAAGSIFATQPVQWGKRNNSAHRFRFAAGQSMSQYLISLYFIF